MNENLFSLTETHKYYDYWKPVINGEIQPDEYQSAIISLVENALDDGLFYSDDVLKYVKENNDFIPLEAWEWQYKRAVVGGIMGMEVYSARKCVDANKIRQEISDGGYVPLTQEIADIAYAQNKKVIIFGGSNTKYNARLINDVVYLMKPYARNKALLIDENRYCKLV